MVLKGVKIACAVLSCLMVGSAWAQGGPAAADPMTNVTVSEDATSFTMTSGVVSARVLKRSGDLISLAYKGTETLTDRSGHAGAYWSHDASGGVETITRVTIDPAKNGGERAEVSVKGISGGRKMGHGAGAAADGDFPADIEIRWSVGRGESGVYTYCIFDHKPEYPAATMTEARFCAKLAAMYDWLSVDEHRNKYYPREEPGEDKYVYTAVQSENLAYGWSSTTQKTGWWIVNPTIEYLSGGPTKVEFLCHRDTTQVQAPCVLNYWRSSHYGGAYVDVAAGEAWTKVVGPFFLYCNGGGAGGDAAALWKDARAQAIREAAKWPYDWVNGVDYPHKNERSTVSGQFVLNDPLMAGGARFIGNLMVGLTAADFSVSRPAPVGARGGAGAAAGGGAAISRTITWQTDAKHYEFWAKSEDKTGKFSVPNVRPGSYTLRAYADGILGDFAKADVSVEPGGKARDLGKVEWAPVRRGRELWQVGIPNRTAKEFAGGDAFFAPDTQIQYAKLFPEDVNFTIGKSVMAKDWYFEHIPHNVDPNATIVPFSGVRSQPGKPTPYSITFDLPAAPAAKDKATLRLAFCTASARTLGVSVNGQNAGQLERLNSNADSTIVRHNIQGIWFERELAIDASLLKQGTNVLTLTVPGGPLNDGVIYDCVRLELAE